MTIVIQLKSNKARSRHGNKIGVLFTTGPGPTSTSSTFSGFSTKKQPYEVPTAPAKGEKVHVLPLKGKIITTHNSSALVFAEARYNFENLQRAFAIFAHVKYSIVMKNEVRTKDMPTLLRVILEALNKFPMTLEELDLQKAKRPSHAFQVASESYRALWNDLQSAKAFLRSVVGTTAAVV
jgi:hypothetical protein